MGFELFNTDDQLFLIGILSTFSKKEKALANQRFTRASVFSDPNGTKVESFWGGFGASIGIKQVFGGCIMLGLFI